MGANAGIAGAAARGAESNVVTNGNQNAVVTVTANNVTLDGLYLDGDDTSVTGAALKSGDDTNVNYGVRPTGAVSNLTVRNNIIKHVFIGLRGDVGPAIGNVITNNWFDSIGNFDFGYCVSLRNNFYADVTHNKMTRAWTGVHINNHNGPGGPVTWSVSNNDISSYAGGILYWLQYNGATSATIDSNHITTEAAAVANNFGMLIVSVQDAVNPTFTINTIAGSDYGIGLFSVPTTSTLTFNSTNSTTGSKLAGVLLTDNLNFNPVGTTNFLAAPAIASTVNLAGLPISVAGGVGVKVDATVATASLLVLSAGTTSNGTGTIGALVTGSLGRIDFSGAAPTASINASFPQYIVMTNGGGSTGDTDATGVKFATLYGSELVLLSDFYALEDKIVHKVDDASLGFVRVNAGNVYVSANSFVVPNTTTPSIQRGIDAASVNDIVNVQAGTFPGALTANKTLSIRGAQFGQDALARFNVPVAESIVDGTGQAAPLVSIGAAGTTFDGFLLQNSTGVSIAVGVASTIQNNDIPRQSGIRRNHRELKRSDA